MTKLKMFAGLWVSPCLMRIGHFWFGHQGIPTFFLKGYPVTITNLHVSQLETNSHQKRPHSALGYLTPIEFEQQNLD